MNGWDLIHHKTAFMPLNLSMQISVPITLTKGANVRLKDLGAELSSLTVLLRVADLEDSVVELDISVLLLQDDGRVRTSEDFIFYNQPVGAGGAVHLRDRMRDANRGVPVDQISLNLDLLPPEVTRVLVVGSLPEGNEMSFDVLDEVVARCRTLPRPTTS